MESPEDTPESISKSIYLGLILVPILWGTTFIVTKHLTRDYPIFFTTGLRHSIALLGLIPFYNRWKHLNGNIIKAGFLTGGANFFAIILQTYGLQTTTSGKAGFITSLYIILIPIFLWLFYSRKIEKKVIIAVILAFLGLALLMVNPQEFLNSSSQPIISTGDLLITGAAILFAFQLIFTERFVKIKEKESIEKLQEINRDKKKILKKWSQRYHKDKIVEDPIDPILFVMVQLLSISILSFFGSLILQEELGFTQISTNGWLQFWYLGIFGTTVPFYFHNWGQKYISSDKTGIIFATEPIFATLFGIWIDNEPFTWQLAIGGTIILIAIYVVIKKEPV